MERLYLVEDPWGLNSAEERFRYAETAGFIRDQIGDRLGSILEIGCGEGLQTMHFAPLADRIVGIDPSLRAVRRARDRGIANASFEVGDLISSARTLNTRFDLVTACEVIYYMEDPEQACQYLNSLGKNCLVTYYLGVSEEFDRFFGNKKVKTETIRGSSQGWRVVWWQNEK
jgi:SAM-dependent methyltransferase